MRKVFVHKKATRGLGLLLGLWLLAGAAWGQSGCSSPPIPGCPEPFVAVSNSGTVLTTFYTGCPVTFVQSSCRPATASINLYYQVLPGTNNTPAGCLPTSQATTYTPTAADAAAGGVTVFELSLLSGGGNGQGFVRNYPVLAAGPPAFTVQPCLNNTALVTVTDNVLADYTIQVNGGPAQALTGRQPLTVAAPAGVATTFILKGIAPGTSCSYTSQQTLTLAPAQVPGLSGLTVQSALPGPVVLDVNSLPAGYTYAVEQAPPGSGSFQVVAPVAPGSTSLTLPAAPAGQYRLSRTDACGNPPAVSVVLPTIALSGTSLNNTNTLTWQTAGAVGGYTLLRNNTALATLPAGTTTYPDRAVVCGTRYTYRLQAAGPGGGQSVSNEVALTTVSSLPPPAPLLNASFTLGNQLLLSASLPGGAALPAAGQLLYSRQGGPANVDFGPVPTATDTLREPTALADLLAAPPCYTARLQDVCGNFSPPNPATCPSLLAVAAADDEALTTRLSWSAFRGPGSPAAGVSYRVLTLAASGAVLARSAPISALTYLDLTPPTDRQILRYRLEASGAGLPPGTVSYSNVASLVRRPRLVVPNAFTPNGDGLNDVLELKGRYLNAFIFVVVDRNGQEVFRATDRSQAWDGTIQGHAPVSAAYVWRFTMQDENNQPFSQTGSVTILK